MYSIYFLCNKSEATILRERKKVYKILLKLKFVQWLNSLQLVNVYSEISLNGKKWAI